MMSEKDMRLGQRECLKLKEELPEMVSHFYSSFYVRLII